MTSACHFPDPIGVGTCGKRGQTQHVSLYADDLVYHGTLCETHRKVLADVAPEFGLVPVGSRTKDAKRRAVYVGKSGTAFTAAQARTWLVLQGELEGHGPGRLGQAQLDRYAETH